MGSLPSKFPSAGIRFLMRRTFFPIRRFSESRTFARMLLRRYARCETTSLNCTHIVECG